jgi:hypothetical protein
MGARGDQRRHQGGGLEDDAHDPGEVPVRRRQPEREGGEDQAQDRAEPVVQPVHGAIIATCPDCSATRASPVTRAVGSTTA